MLSLGYGRRDLCRDLINANSKPRNLQGRCSIRGRYVRTIFYSTTVVTGVEDVLDNAKGRSLKFKSGR